jgi:hypothetical protein
MELDKIDLDKFYSKITKVSTSAYILVPHNIMKYTGLELGEEVIVYIARKNKQMHTKDGGVKNETN